jgi:hypothetical protein
MGVNQKFEMVGFDAEEPVACSQVEVRKDGEAIEAESGECHVSLLSDEEKAAMQAEADRMWQAEFVGDVRFDPHAQKAILRKQEKKSAKRKKQAKASRRKNR